MNNIELQTPEGYFEDSFSRTMSGVSAVRKRRAAVLGSVAALILVAVITYTTIRIHNAGLEKAYYAQQEELAGLDVFLEIN